MPHYLAFLRGINLGNRRVKMDHLAELFRALKFTDVQTFIASGNVIFSSKSSAVAKLTNEIEQHLHASLGYEVDTFLRTRDELSAIATFQPFSAADMTDPTNTVHVGFFAGTLTPNQRSGLAACRSATDEIRLEDRDYYWLCRGIKSHESKVWTSPAIRALKLPSSSLRNLTTIRKLAELYPAQA
jgi:uncharacterized protein (DUF1697 family)